MLSMHIRLHPTYNALVSAGDIGVNNSSTFNNEMLQFFTVVYICVPLGNQFKLMSTAK